MATIIVDPLDAEDGNPTDIGAPEQQTQQQQSPAPTEPVANPDDDMPEKFRGKQLKDIVKAYEELEKHSGRQGAELGELRRTHDEIIRSSLEAARGSRAQAIQQEPAAEDDTDYFVNPRKAIADAVEKHPLVQQLRDAQAVSAREKALNALGTKHADYADVIGSEEFVTFVRSNPVFGQLMRHADANYDIEAASYVLDQFKSTRQPAAVPAAPAKAATEELRRAVVADSKVPAGAAAPSSDSGKKIYRRSYLIDKMQKDPEWYAANADEIYKAYEEGRVR